MYQPIVALITESAHSPTTACLHSPTLLHILAHYSTLSYTVPRSPTLHYTLLHYTTLSYTTSPSRTLRYNYHEASWSNESK